jgi:hypothetical protein
MGSRGHVPSCQTLSAVASHGPGAGNVYLLLKAPRRVDQTPEPLLGLRREAGRADR